jgi:hypothetical protein
MTDTESPLTADKYCRLQQEFQTLMERLRKNQEQGLTEGWKRVLSQMPWV